MSQLRGGGLRAERSLRRVMVKRGVESTAGSHASSTRAMVWEKAALTSTVRLLTTLRTAVCPSFSRATPAPEAGATKSETGPSRGLLGQLVPGTPSGRPGPLVDENASCSRGYPLKQ